MFNLPLSVCKGTNFFAENQIFSVKKYILYVKKVYTFKAVVHVHRARTDAAVLGLQAQGSVHSASSNLPTPSGTPHKSLERFFRACGSWAASPRFGSPKKYQSCMHPRIWEPSPWGEGARAKGAGGSPPDIEQET